jgi:DNA-directed RNA polymerase specialized sigma24 family protein
LTRTRSRSTRAIWKSAAVTPACDDYDDVLFVPHVEVWRSLVAYDPARSKLPVQRYVFSCVTNQVKDLLKRKRRHEVYIEDMTVTMRDGDELGDSFTEEYLSVSHDDVYADVERELPPTIPDTLTRLEREVVVRLYIEPNHRKIAVELSLTRAEVDGTVESICTKMAEWSPAGRVLPGRALRKKDTITLRRIFRMSKPLASLFPPSVSAYPAGKRVTTACHHISWRELVTRTMRRLLAPYAASFAQK